MATEASSPRKVRRTRDDGFEASLVALVDSGDVGCLRQVAQLVSCGQQGAVEAVDLAVCDGNSRLLEEVLGVMPFGEELELSHCLCGSDLAMVAMHWGWRLTDWRSGGLVSDVAVLEVLLQGGTESGDFVGHIDLGVCPGERFLECALEFGALDPNGCVSFGSVPQVGPLMAAVELKWARGVEILIEHGASVSSQHPEIDRYDLNPGVDLEFVEHYRYEGVKFPLEAALFSSQDVIDVLLLAGATLEATPSRLLSACYDGADSLACLLIDHGAVLQEPPPQTTGLRSLRHLRDCGAMPSDFLGSFTETDTQTTGRSDC